MAFASRIGNLFKHAVDSSLSLHQATRCMSSSRLFVGGLSYGTDDQSLREAFSSFGEVTEARIIIDRETNRSRGFGFVSFTSMEEASNAMSAMDGKDLQGRIVRVNYATERTGGFRGGGYGGGGSYGGGYGGGGSNYSSGDGYNAGGGRGYGGSGSDGGYAGSGGFGGSDGNVGGGMNNNSNDSYGGGNFFKDDDEEYANRRG